MSVYYTYYSYEQWGRGYIGYRKCPKKVTPETDRYFGSFSDKTFKPTDKIILGVYNSKEEAIRDEITLHAFYKVDKNPHFANRACQTSEGFSFSASGEKHHHYGKTPSAEARKKMSNSHSGKKLSKEHIYNLSGKNSARYNPVDWYHPEYGEVLKTSLSDLAKIFSDQNLDTSGLSKVVNRKLFHSNGWRLLENKDIEKQYGKLRSWCSISHGFAHNVSVRDLVNRYPDDNLLMTGLCSVCSGRKRFYKGWIFIDKTLIDESLPGDELSKIFSKDYAISEINKRRDCQKRDRKKPSARILKDWVHPEYGIIRQVSVSQLVKSYDFLGLSPGLLYQVIWGSRAHHKGWKCLSGNADKP
jgi:hypothetical protein